MTEQAAAQVLAAYGPAAGLGETIAPFARVGSLEDRFKANPFLMAPMAGVSDAAYRMMARSGGAALAYSEMVSVAGIHYGGEKTWELVIPQEPEPDLAVQLFGSKPAQFREAACQVTERLGNHLALLDINMACPVPKVTRKGEGSALMDDPANAYEIVRACREGVEEGARTAGIEPVPVTCKIRRGFKTGHELAPVFAEAMEEAGAQAIAVHGRFADQLYRGQADWTVISRVKALVKHVPVIASGDIMTPQAAVQVMEQTGASAVMVARGTYGNPWLFSDALALRGGGQPLPHDVLQRLAALECHIRLLAATHAHMARGRSLAGWYLKGLPEAARWRNEAMACVTLDDFLAVIGRVRAVVEEGAGA